METVGDSRSSSKEKRSFEVMSKPLAKKRKKIFYPPLHVTNLARMNQSKACSQQLDGSNVPRMKIKQKSQSHSQQHVTSKLTKTKSLQRHKVQEEQRQRTKHLGKNHMQVKTRSGKARKDPQKLDKNKLMEKGKELENIESENEDYEEDFMESDHEMIREDEEREGNVDEEIREDEQREVDDDEDEEIREDEQREVQQPKNHRGPTKCLKVHERGIEARPVVILDKFGVPIGPTDNILNELSSFLGTLGRNPRRTPLDKNWHEIGKEDKDSLWDYVKEKYSIADSGRKWTLQTINSAWRRWKCLLKRQCFTGLKNDGERWKKRPKTVPKGQFRVLLKIWHSQTGRKASEKNKESRNSQTLLHTAGSKSFARIRRDMEKELNRPLIQKVSRGIFRLLL